MGSKNIMLILVAVLVVAGAFILAEYRNSQTKKFVYNATVSTTTIDTISLELQNQDSDSDGLKDWEEVLLGTDPRNPDTDKDGTPDGKEVTSGRNPLVKGPNDSTKVGSTNGIPNKENLTQTDILARDFFARYMELNQIGMSGDQGSQTELIGQVLKNGIVLSIPKTYTFKDILVTQDTSKESIKKYGNEVGGIFQKNQISGRDEAVIAQDSIEKEDPEILKEIDPIISSYKNIIHGLLKTSAPQSMVNMHMDFINAMSKFLFVAESLRQTNVDALKGLQGASKYLDAGESLFNVLRALTKYFISLGITFNPSDGGSMFIPH